MSNIPEQPLYIYRMVHFDNIQYILSNGICTQDHAGACKEYVNIGDGDLINKRKNYPVSLPFGGKLSDYIPFYFGGHSPMLLNIKTGYRDIEKQPQENLVFLCLEFYNVIKQCNEWCFTDGHPIDHLTEYYNRVSDLKYLDWSVISLQYWYPTPEDPDRIRRKQAEFLVKGFVPCNCITKICVYTNERKIEVENILKTLGLTIPVEVDESHKLYYDD